MAKFTDANVPLKCPECNAYLEGIQETISHILSYHEGDYPIEDAAIYAQQWIELSHQDQDEQLRDYYADRKIDRAIEADAFPRK
jgi:hypothetical protein